MTELHYFGENSSQPFIKTINPTIKPNIGESVCVEGEYFVIKDIIWTFQNNNSIIKIYVEQYYEKQI